MKSFRIIVISIFMFTVLVFSAAAGGNKEVPDLEVSTSGTQYISPDGNGIQDSAELDFKVKIYVKSKKGYVPEYGLSIKNSSGDVITEVVEKEKSDINWFIRIFTKYSEFTLEKTVKWDGLDTDGNKVPDGVYNVELWVKDSSGNIDDVALDEFVVDVEVPSVELIGPENNIFSPNDDGNMDQLVIKQEKSTTEVLWTGEVLDKDNNVVKTFKWETLLFLLLSGMGLIITETRQKTESTVIELILQTSQVIKWRRNPYPVLFLIQQWLMLFLNFLIHIFHLMMTAVKIL